jgi:hypothetical protein
MNRSTRRFHFRRVRTRLLRLHYVVSGTCCPARDALKHSPFWISNEPKWWQRLHNLRPSRRQQKQMLHAIGRGLDPDAVGRWPDYRKPHIYYW